jgi:hypothetical protein
MVTKSRDVDVRKGSPSARTDRRPDRAFTRRAVVVKKIKVSMVEG